MGVESAKSAVVQRGDLYFRSESSELGGQHCDRDTLSNNRLVFRSRLSALCEQGGFCFRAKALVSDLYQVAKAFGDA